MTSIRLQALDVEEDCAITVEEPVLRRSKILDDVLSMVDDDSCEPIQLPNVTHSVVCKIIEYCEYHQVNDLQNTKRKLRINY